MRQAQTLSCPVPGTWRQRLFAWALAHVGKKLEKCVAPYKGRLLTDLSGTVLEIGPGTGANLRYLAKERVRWLGIEPNPSMYPYLEHEANHLGIQIDVRPGTAERLPAPDKSVDAVVSTLVLCCVPDQRRALQEVLRVRKPGGKFVFIEHVAAPHGTWLRCFQHWVSPLWRRMGDGCRPDRETWLAIEQAGFTQLTYEHCTMPVPLASPHIIGVAVKSP
jgi:ubiquinone/menaquinone biosynthesis C-methylase UbiE